MTVNTKAVAGRRTLRFSSLAEVVADAERLVAADRNGTLKRLGNWTTGQNIGHVAYWMERPFDGYPPGFGPPGIIRWILKFKKNAYVNKGMPTGVRIPRVENGTLGTEVMEETAALERLRRAADKLQRTAPTAPNIIFGPMTHQEWIMLNLRHAELHFGFLIPE